MSKRSRESEDIEDLRKKVKEMQDHLENIVRSQELVAKEPCITHEEMESGNEYSDMEILEELGEKENVAPIEEIEIEIPLEESVLEVLGKDPSQSEGLKIKLHSSLITRWQYWASKGILKEDKEALLEKYSRHEVVQGPAINPEIIPTLTEAAVKRDKYMVETQESAGSAMMAIGAAITMLLGDEKSADPWVMLERLSEGAKLITEILFKQSQSRKAFIVPGLSKQIRDLLEKTDRYPVIWKQVRRENYRI